MENSDCLLMIYIASFIKQSNHNTILMIFCQVLMQQPGGKVYSWWIYFLSWQIPSLYSFSIIKTFFKHVNHLHVQCISSIIANLNLSHSKISGNWHFLWLERMPILCNHVLPQFSIQILLCRMFAYKLKICTWHYVWIRPKK